MLAGCLEVLYEAIHQFLIQLQAWYRWMYINWVRIGLGQAQTAKLTDISVLYKSQHFLVVNKREDIKVNSDSTADKITVETQLRHMYPERVSQNAAHGFRFCHRLDYPTSGCLCLATTKTGARWASKAFRKRYTTKHYIALVRGHVSESVQHVDSAIGRDGSITDICKMVTSDHVCCQSPRDASTTVILLQRGIYDGQPASKVLLIPHTGRTHQLRVHCAHIGHLIVGDYTYSNRADIKPYRMMLHAYRLIIPMKYEHIDVMADDTFTPEKDSKWQPKENIQLYKESAENIDKLGQSSSIINQVLV